MKNTKLLLLILMVFSLDMTAFAQEVPKKYPIMTFEQRKYDLGTLHEGDIVERTYTFTNTGNAPLIISKIRASCGCTVPSGWKKEPIMPGEKSSFKVKFNTRHKLRKQHKTITITCNTKSGRELVSFQAYVIPDPKLEKQREERRKKWAAQRAAQQKNKSTEKDNKMHALAKNKKRYSQKKVIKRIDPKKKYEIDTKVIKEKIEVKKLELKILKKEEKLLRKKEKWSKEKIKKEQSKINDMRQKIIDYNKKIYQLRKELSRN